MNGYVRCPRLNDEERVLVTLPFLKSRQWIERKERMQTLPRAWDVFTRQPRGKFKPAHSHLRNRLFTLTQTSTVETYIDRFQDYSLDIDDLPAQEAKFLSIRGLNTSVRTHVFRAVDLDQAIHLALPFDDGNADQPLAHPSYDDATPMDLDYLAPDHPRFQRRQGRAHRPPPLPPPRTNRETLLFVRIV